MAGLRKMRRQAKLIAGDVASRDFRRDASLRRTMIQFRASAPTSPPPPYEVTSGMLDLFRFTVHNEHGHPHSETCVEVDTLEDDEWRAFSTLRRQLVALIKTALRAPDPEAWLAFWQTEDHLDTFGDLFDGLRGLWRQLCEGDHVSEHVENHACHSRVVSRFPELEAQVSFVEGTLARSMRVCGELVRNPAPSHRRNEDADCAARFNYFASWTLMALNTLLVITDEDEDDDRPPVVVDQSMLGMITVTAREFALAANHAARDGQRLRREVVEVAPPTTDGDDLADADAIDDADLADVEQAISDEEGANVTVEGLAPENS